MAGKIKIAIAGVGNCASSLVQGLEYYDAKTFRSKRPAGLMRHNLGGYRPEDIEVVAAFDIDDRKVGRPLSEAIFAPPNCTKAIVQSIKPVPVRVSMGDVLDGVASHMDDYPPERRFVVSRRKPCDVSAVLRKSGAHMLLNYLPVGSEEATKFYAEACLKAGAAFINCVPVFVASSDKWEKRFSSAGLPVIGDDIKSQIGATIVHRALARLFEDRGVAIDSTYQLNVGGNTDFLNMLNHSRLKSKKISKTAAVQSQLEKPLDDLKIHIGPSDYIPWLNDNKVCFLRMEGRGFGNVPVNIELRLSVEDSPNSSGVVIDAIRCCKLALDRGIGGALISPSAYFMKHPPLQVQDDEARKMVAEFIEGSRQR